MGREIQQMIAVAGPTATGKSAFAVRLALALGGEIVSGDAFQVYRGMDIGTAKITEAERRGIPHHLLDLLRPGESFSAAVYQSLARQAFDDIDRRGHTPIIAGGSGLYMDSALYPYAYSPEKAAGEGGAGEERAGGIRAALAREAAQSGGEALLQKLRQEDPLTAARLHPHDTRRIVRALEYVLLHGRPISGNQAARRERRPLRPTLYLALDLPRPLLYEQIDRRVDQMLAAGLLSEVTELAAQGLTPDCQAGRAIGYRQLLAHLAGVWDLPTAVAAVKQESRRYAKRQLTWFRANPAVLWLDARAARDTDLAKRLGSLLRGAAGGADPAEVAAFLRRQGALYDMR